MTQQLQQIIDSAWDNRANLSPASAPKEVTDAVEHVIAELNNGKLRVATREGVGQWTVHQWIKKAVLLSFRLKDNAVMKAGDLAFFDKVQTKFAHLSEAELKATGVRVVPPAVAGVYAEEDLAFPEVIRPLTQRIQVVECHLNALFECINILGPRRKVGREEDLPPVEPWERRQDVFELALRHAVKPHAGGGNALQHFEVRIGLHGIEQAIDRRQAAQARDALLDRGAVIYVSRPMLRADPQQRLALAFPPP